MRKPLVNYFLLIQSVNLILIHFQLCQIQLQQLQIMGVAQEHCEQILDNVDILRQSILGGMVH